MPGASRELAQRSDDLLVLEEKRASLRQAAEFIATADEETVRDGQDTVKLIREWGKIRKLSAEIRVELLALEISCLRRLAQLDAIDHLTGSPRGAAKWLATDIDAEALIPEFPECYTATGLYHAFRQREWARVRAEQQARWDRGEHTEEERIWLERRRRRMERQCPVDIDGSEPIEDPWADMPGESPVPWMYQGRDTVTEMINEQIGDQESEFTVDNLVSAVMEFGEIEPELRHGVAEMCRSALRRGTSTSTILPDGTHLPRFIVYTTPGDPEWRRIVVAHANLAQFRDMVHLRQVQFQQDRERLHQLRGQLAIVTALAEQRGCPPGATMHEILNESCMHDEAEFVSQEA